MLATTAPHTEDAGRTRYTRILAGLWAVMTVVWTAVLLGQGLRAQYFEDPSWTGAPVSGGLDASISTGALSRHWWFAVPDHFSAQWSGFLMVDRPGSYTFATTSDDGTMLYIDGQLVVDNGGVHEPITRTGAIQLGRGAHQVLLRYFQEVGDYSLSWQWARDGGALAPVPRWALSARPRDYWTVPLARGLDWAWLVSTCAGGLAVLGAARRRGYGRILRSRRALRLTALAVVTVGLAAFYLAGAVAHARRVNTFKARGDQTNYLGEAQEIYQNWHGRNPPSLVGRRSRMPLYEGYLALFWNPRESDDRFFERAKILNIALSIPLLALLAALFRWRLPSLVAANLTLIVTFGYFIFKAGYAQAELLFYFLFFVAFLACCDMFTSRTVRGRLALGAIAGTLAALAHLTKASVLPLMGIFLAVYGVREIGLLFIRRRQTGVGARGDALRIFLWHALAGGLTLAFFLGVLSPYISNSKRAFGSYFYNVNTTFYMWYDDWPDASVGTRLHQDDVGWPTMPASEIPSPQKYWRTHSVRSMLDRIAGGLNDMIVRSYTTYWYLKYVALYCAFAVALVVTNPRPFGNLLREHQAMFAFLLLYAVVYTLSVAFYAPISGTGTTRFLLAHVAPLMFVLSSFFARAPFSETRWTVGGATLTPAHFHLLVFATLGLDLTFTIWPRLMSTYGGF